MHFEKTLAFGLKTKQNSSDQLLQAFFPPIIVKLEGFRSMSRLFI